MDKYDRPETEEDADLVTAFNRLRFRNGMNIIKLRGINGI
jgi:hypothetical protein